MIFSPGRDDSNFGMGAGPALALSLLCSAFLAEVVLGQECDNYGPRKDCGMITVLIICFGLSLWQKSVLGARSCGSGSYVLPRT
jgi:MFS-type transporter involved in bile tolerance (Atg22 family)